MNNRIAATIAHAMASGFFQEQHKELVDRRTARSRRALRLHVARHGQQKRAPGHRSLNPKQRSDEMRARRRFLALGTPCQHCGGTDRLEVSHCVPVASGAGNLSSNLQWLCHRCHVEYDDRYGVGL